MAAAISIYVGEGTMLPSASGIGFYGDGGFDSPVALGEFQGRVFMTDPSGTVEGEELDNCRLLAAGSWSGVNGVSGVILGQTGDGIPLRNVPNRSATLNIRFLADFACRTQNTRVMVGDRNAPGSSPSGLRAYGAEIRHQSLVQESGGLGDASWVPLAGSGSYLTCVSCPGTSGVRPDGEFTLDVQHDWYIALSCTPTQPGDLVSFAVWVDLEYS
jgi:hypothetical protein